MRSASLILTLAVVSSCSHDRPTGPNQSGLLGPASAATADPVIVAAGDIACGSHTEAGLPCEQAATAALIGTIAPTAVLPLGDTQYETGTLANFKTYYGPTWGVYKSISWPAVGNHEYGTAGAAGYFDYFNGVGVQSGRAGDRSKGYYSFDLGAWHLIAINSNCGEIGGCGAGSPQEQWLRADLAASPAACTLAYWHHARFTSGEQGSSASMQPIWQALYDYGADLVLAGHDHDFERFAPQTATGKLDLAQGLRSFVVGTGGKDLRAFETVRANSELRNNSSFGVLKLTLHANNYDWKFVPIPGDPLADAGTATCHASSPVQTTLTIPASADTYILKTSPTQAFGTGSALVVDYSPPTRTYLKFPVAGIGSKTVASAKLQLYAIDPAGTGGRLHRVPSTSWDESTITWSNAPAYSSTVIGKIGSVVVNTWYEIDVKSQISGDGTVSFALESPSTNTVKYRSREAGATWAPRLVIGVQ